MLSKDRSKLKGHRRFLKVKSKTNAYRHKVKDEIVILEEFKTKIVVEHKNIFNIVK